MASKSEKRRIFIYVNGKEVEDNLRSLTSTSRKLRNELAGLDPTTEKFAKKSKDLQKVNGRIDDIRKQTKGMNGVLGKAKSLMSGLGGALLGGGIIAGIGSLAKGIWDLTSNMEQIDKKSKIVFGTSLPAITRAAEENADKMGIANSEYVKLATNNADLLKPMGMTTKNATDMTNKTLELAGALSEWTGGTKDTTEVSEILTKAMLGEREQLKTLGISIMEVDVKNRLIAEGKNKLTGLALQQAKAEATLQLMLEKSTDAQTAYNDASDSMLRKKKTFTAFWGDIKDAVGNAFMDAGNEIAYFIDNLEMDFNQIKKLSNETLGTSFDVEPIENFSNAILHTAPGIKDLTKDVEKYTIATDEGKAKMKQLGATLIETYGAENGKKIFNTFLAEQTKAAQTMQRQEANQQQFALDAAIASAKEKAAKEVEATLKGRAKLQEKIDKQKEDAKLKALTDDEADLERIRMKYDKMLEEDALNEEQKKEIELLRAEELALKEEEQELKRQEKNQKLFDEKIAFEEQMELMRLEGIDKELAEADAKYESLYAKADKLGLDTKMLQSMHAEEQLRITKKYKDKEVKAVTESEKAKRDAQLETASLVTGLLGNMIELSGASAEETKGVNSAIALADTYVSANKAYASQLIVGDPTSPARAALAATVAITAGLANVKKINSAGGGGSGDRLTSLIKDLDSKSEGRGMAKGGFTGGGVGMPDETGFKVAGYVHEDEWVAPKWMTTSPQYADTIKMLEAARQAKSGFAQGGPVTSTNTNSTTPTFTESSTDNSDLTSAIITLNQLLASGIKAQTIIDQTGLIALQESLDELNQLNS